MLNIKKLAYQLTLAIGCVLTLSACKVTFGVYDPDHDYRDRARRWENNRYCDIWCRQERERMHNRRVGRIEHRRTSPRPAPRPVIPQTPVGQQEYCSYPENAHKVQCGGHNLVDGNFYSFNTELTPFVSQNPKVIQVADKYEISDYAATYIVRALMLAEQNDLSGIKDLGLSKSDLLGLKDGKDLSSDKLVILSEKLALSLDDTKQLVFDISNDAMHANESK